MYNKCRFTTKISLYVHRELCLGSKYQFRIGTTFQLKAWNRLAFKLKWNSAHIFAIHWISNIKPGNTVKLKWGLVTLTGLLNQTPNFSFVCHSISESPFMPKLQKVLEQHHKRLIKQSMNLFILVAPENMTCSSWMVNSEDICRICWVLSPQTSSLGTLCHPSNIYHTGIGMAF